MMKERQRWKPEEDALLSSYVKQYGPREWNQVSTRMNAPTFDRDSKSCLERWKNYLKPGLKKGSLTVEEQRLVIQLQAKHGNKWKKIAAELPGRTAKRLGKWWEVFKERQQREHNAIYVEENGKYDHILETFAEKLVKERQQQHPPPLRQQILNPSGFFLPNSSITSCTSISPPPTQQPPLLFPQISRSNSPPSMDLNLSPSNPSTPDDSEYTTEHHRNRIAEELTICCREMEEVHKGMAELKRESAWRLRRVEMQLESEKRSKRREKMEEVEMRLRALREEERDYMERTEEEYQVKMMNSRRETEEEEEKLMVQWFEKQRVIMEFVRQVDQLR